MFRTSWHTARFSSFSHVHYDETIQTTKTTRKTGRIRPTRCHTRQTHSHGHMGPLRGAALRHTCTRRLASRDRFTDDTEHPIYMENAQRRMQHKTLSPVDVSLLNRRTRCLPYTRSLPLVSLTHLDARRPFHISVRYSGQLLLLVRCTTPTSDRAISHSTGRDCGRETHSR